VDAFVVKKTVVQRAKEHRRASKQRVDEPATQTRSKQAS